MALLVSDMAGSAGEKFLLRRLGPGQQAQKMDDSIVAGKGPVRPGFRSVMLVFVDCQLRWEEGKMKGSTKSAEMDEPFKCRDDTRRLGYVLFESGATGA
jgi:hypothetical protein